MHRMTLLTAVIAALVAAEPAAAADTAPEVVQLEQIMITARKREETLQDAPVAISVVSAKQIESVGITRVTEIAARLPNVSSVDQPAGAGVFSFTPFIRGINTYGRNIGFESGFGMFLNGAYAGRNEAANKFLPDVERVEFLPGPQATLFGKNTTIGVMNIVTRKPGPEWGGALDARIGNYGAREYRANASGPVSDNVGITLTAGRREYDGYYRNVIPPDRQVFDPDGKFNGREGPLFESTGGSAELVADIGPTSLDLLIDYTHAERDNDVYLARVEGFDALPVDVRESATMGTHELREAGGVLTLTADIGPGVLTAITAHRDFDSDVPFDGDAYAYPVQEGPTWSTDQVLTSQEIRYGGTADRLGYIVGAYWQDQELESVRVARILNLADIRVEGKIESTVMAAFGNVDFQLSDRWRAELGVRWEDEEKTLREYQQSGGTMLGLIDIDVGPLDRGVDNVSYTAMLAFEPTPDINTHFRYSRGFKSGGYNIDFVTAPVLTPLEFDDETGDHYELGAKMQLADALFVNAVLFRTDYKDLQQSEYTLVPGQSLPVITTKNSGEARTEGLELTAQYEQDNLSVNASLGTANARYTRWVRQTATGFSDESGKKLPAPDLTFNLLADYRIPLGTGALTATAEYLYRSRAPQSVTMPSGPVIPSDPASTPRPSYHADAVDVLNFRLRYDITDHWSVTAWVRNALDDRAIIVRQPNDAEGFFEIFGLFAPEDIRRQVTGDYQAPRHYGLDVRYRFGG